jgi:hypothetical protein
MLNIFYITGRSINICERAHGTFTCPNNLVIKIGSARYGNAYGTDYCPHAGMLSYDADCIYDARTTVAASCDGRNTCTLTPTNNLRPGPDACPSTVKYLEIEYNCIVNGNCFYISGVHAYVFDRKCVCVCARVS